MSGGRPARVREPDQRSRLRLDPVQPGRGLGGVLAGARRRTGPRPRVGPAQTMVRTWTPVSCKGAKGCAQSGDEDECDDTLAAPGDPCPRNPPLDYACATDLKSALVCKDGRFSLWRRCRGPEGCSVVDGRNVHCDTSLGEADDPCEHMGTFACSVDGQMMLECDGKALVPPPRAAGPRPASSRRASRARSLTKSTATTASRSRGILAPSRAASPARSTTRRSSCATATSSARSANAGGAIVASTGPTSIATDRREA